MSPTADITEISRVSTESDAERIAWFIREVVRLRPKLYQQAMRIARNHSDAEDLVQETLTKAYGGLDRFRSGTNFAAWLYRIMVNSYINGYRKQKRRPQECPTDDITDAQLATFAKHTSTGLRSAEDHALDRLPDGEVRAHWPRCRSGCGSPSTTPTWRATASRRSPNSPTRRSAR